MLTLRAKSIRFTQRTTWRMPACRINAKQTILAQAALIRPLEIWLLVTPLHDLQFALDELCGRGDETLQKSRPGARKEESQKLGRPSVGRLSNTIMSVRFIRRWEFEERLLARSLSCRDKKKTNNKTTPRQMRAFWRKLAHLGIRRDDCELCCGCRNPGGTGKLQRRGKTLGDVGRRTRQHVGRGLPLSGEIFFHYSQRVSCEDPRG